MPSTSTVTTTNAKKTLPSSNNATTTNPNVNTPTASGHTVGSGLSSWTSKQLQDMSTANYWQYQQQYSAYFNQYYKNNPNAGAAANFHAQAYHQFQQYQQNQNQNYHAVAQAQNKSQDNATTPSSLSSSLSSQHAPQHQHHYYAMAQNKKQKTNQKAIACKRTTTQSSKFMNQDVLLSPFISQTHPINNDDRISQFSRILLSRIELLLIGDTNPLDKHIGFRLTGCTCSYLDQVSGKSLEGFVYRPSTLDKFCDFLPVFYIHLRDDKCPNVPKSLYRDLNMSFAQRTQGVEVMKELCGRYFTELGIRNVPGQGLRMTEVNEPKPQEVIHVEDDEEVICMSDAVVFALEGKTSEPDIPPEPSPPPSFSIPILRQSLIPPDMPNVLLKLIQSIEFHQALPPNKLLCRCMYCHDTNSALQIHSLSTLSNDLHHYFLYHHLNNCGDIPGEVVINLKRQRPALFSKEYYANREILNLYMEKIIATMQLEDTDGGVYCKSGGPGSMVESFES